MTVVCFTGSGNLPGHAITRPDWERAAATMGWSVSKSAKSCDVLVASRDDTVKAKNARSSGKTIMTYEEFAGECYMSGIRFIGGAPTSEYTQPGSPYDLAEKERQAARDRIAKKLEAFQAEQERKEKMLADMQQNPLFGTF